MILVALAEVHPNPLVVNRLVAEVQSSGRARGVSFAAHSFSAVLCMLTKDGLVESCAECDPLRENPRNAGTVG